jgi:hypothetical protein
MAFREVLLPVRMLFRRALLAVLALGVSTMSLAHAATDLAPITARLVELGELSALTYYTVEKDGFRVVTTIQSNDALEGDASMTPVRFIVTLAASQEARISVPRDSGPAIELRIARIGDRLEVSRAQEQPADEQSASDR